MSKITKDLDEFIRTHSLRPEPLEEKDKNTSETLKRIAKEVQKRIFTDKADPEDPFFWEVFK